MTDLTPELEKWLVDGHARGWWNERVDACSQLEQSGITLGIHSQSILYAHALHLQQQAKIDTLKGALTEILDLHPCMATSVPTVVIIARKALQEAGE